MKFLFTSFFAITIALTSFSQNYSISNVVFDPTTPATLVPGEYVNITYDYQKTGGNIRIGIVPHIKSGFGSSGTSGYALKTDDTGSGDARFTYKNGAVIDSVSFRFVDLDWSLLWDTVVAVDYTFHSFYVRNFQTTPASPGILNFGDSIKFNFDFEQTYGNVKINALAMSNNIPIDGQIHSEAQSFSSETGTVNGFIKLNNFASVDQILIQFLDETSNDTLLELEQDIYFSYTNEENTSYSISNVVCTPSSPGNITLNERVEISFNYSKPYGNVRIYLDPIVSEGSYNYGTSGSQLFTENSGTGTGHFVFYNEAKVEKVVFRIRSTSGITLHEHIEDVFFTISADSNLVYSINDIKLSPESPETLNTGDTIRLSFNYSKPFGDVNFFVKPYKNGELNVGYEVPSLLSFSNNVDSIETFIIYDIATNFDQINIQMRTSLNRLLVEETVNVDYTFVQVPFNISNIVLNPASPDSLSFRDSLQINFDYKNLEDQANVILQIYANGQLLNGTNNIVGVLNNNSGTVSAFLKVSDVLTIDQIKIRIEDLNGTLISETPIDVNFDFVIPTFANRVERFATPTIYPNPAKNIVNIQLPEGSFEYSISGINGKLIESGWSPDNVKTINVSDYEKGLYLIKTKYREKIHVQKISIQ